MVSGSRQKELPSERWSPQGRTFQQHSETQSTDRIAVTSNLNSLGPWPNFQLFQYCRLVGKLIILLGSGGEEHRAKSEVAYHSIGHDVVPIELSAIMLLLIKLLTLRNKVLQLQWNGALHHHYIIDHPHT